MNELVGILTERFGLDEPILTEDVEAAFPSTPRRTLFSHISKAVEAGRLVRFETGVYYVPSAGLLGLAELDPLKVIARKYLFTPDGESTGFWSGTTLDNNLGLTTQVPVVYEVVTDNTSVPQRTVRIGGYVTCIVRKSKVPVKGNDVRALQLLDILTRRKPQTLSPSQRKRVKALGQGVDMKELLKMSLFYPQKTTRRLAESEAIGVLA